MPSTWKQWWALPQSKITLVVLLGVFVVAILSKWTGSNGTPQYSRKFVKQLNRVVNQASKWHATSKQDIDPVLRLMHANYALAYAQTARSLASDASIENMTGIRLSELMYHLEDEQRESLQNLVAQCPNVKPSGILSTGSAWM